MKPTEIRLQNAEQNIGITENPVIAWRYEQKEGSRKQKACRIFLYEITVGDRQEAICVYDSKELKTGRQTNHLCKCHLKSHTQYQVKVSVKDDRENWEEGKSKFFFSGITQKSDWKGVWISRGINVPHYLAKEIILKEKPVCALLSCAGVGQYEVMVNGKYPDDSVLNGSWTDFNKRIHYQTYDITQYLECGEAEFLFHVGNGWYSADTRDKRHFYTTYMGYEAFGEYPAAIATITFIYKDGRREIFGTDETWWSAESETVYTNIYGSEDYDARREGKRKKDPVVLLNQEKAPKGVLVPMLYPSVKVKKVYHGTLIKKLEDGGVLYDLGQNMTGLFEITVRGERGVRIRIFPVEKLDAEGNPWPTVDSWCCYTLKGEQEETWRPKFAYQAGRYIKISLDEQSEQRKLPEVLGVSGYFVTSSAKDAGSFWCSDYRCMQIHDLVLKAVESNLQHVHTDCPTIERLGWQEPNHLMGPSVFYTKGAETLWSKIAADERDSQYDEREQDLDQGAFPHFYSSGLLPSIAPRYAKFLEDGGEGSFWDIVPWGSSILMAAYEQYRFTGNKETLFANYETAKRYINYLYKKYLDYPFIYKKEKGIHFLCHGLGDWGIEQNRGESRENIETAYLYRDLILLSETAQWLGKDTEAGYYAGVAQDILESYNRLLLKWNPQTGEWAYGSYEKTGQTPTQATQAIPLCFGMVPQEKKESVQKSLLILCEDRKIHAGEIGMPYILRALMELKQTDLILDMITQNTHPSYYRFIEKGETTMPEFWRDDSRSRNHDMMGSILEWFYRGIAGISSEDGFETVRIEPSLPKSINYVICNYEAITGKIELTLWRDSMKNIQMKILIPPNTKGVVNLGGKTTKIEGGLLYCLKSENEDY